MRKLAFLVVIAFLVNLPYVQEELTTHALQTRGREVVAGVTRTVRAGGHAYVDYRLPAGVDRSRTRYTAEIDLPTWRAARASGQLLVRVVPGEPRTNRPDGMVRRSTFRVIAAVGDMGLILLGFVWWRRHRRWGRFTVVRVEEGGADPLVRLRAPSYEVVAAVPQGWDTRVRPGRRVHGSLHLVAEHDLRPGAALAGLQRLSGARYVAHGQVADLAPGRVLLTLADGPSLQVDTGPHRTAVDLHDSTAVTGLLCFTPTVARGGPTVT